MLLAAQNFHRSTLRALLLICAVLAACVLLPAASAAAAPAFRVPFSYYADHQELSAVLTNFARTQGMSASVTPRVKGTVSGRFQDVDPMTFLSGMESAFNASWYQLGNTLHFYDTSETQKAMLVPKSGSAGQLLTALRGSGVFSPQLPPKLSQSGDMITVQGPPDYLDQIRAAAAAFENAQVRQTTMRVFPLKHAWAEDMTVSSMSQNVTVPGVASILRAMVTGSPVSPSRVTQDRATVEKLGGKGLASVGQGNAGSELPAAAPSSSATAGGASIMADPRVNAVIVNDAAYRMPFYEQVIRDLDKPVELVEIHAAIVDIDTEFKRELGISLQGAKNRSSGLSAGGTSSGTDFSGSGMPGYAGAASNAGLTLSTIYTHGTDFFLSRIQALEENDDARVLGRPSVLTVDNIQATLENTTTYYVEVQGYQAVDLYKVEAGTVLRVTPHIIREHGKTAIKLAVSVQDDQDTTSTITTTNAGVPPIKQTKINTQAVVGSGQSLLIGGYYYEQKSNKEGGVPLLKDIPVLGHLFKTTAKKGKRMERLILITPRIVSPNENNVPVQTDDASMHRAAGQADYEPRIPARPVKKPGCASSRPTPERAASISARE